MHSLTRPARQQAAADQQLCSYNRQADGRCRCCVAGDRILTPWLTVLGRGLDGMPLVEVQLRRAGDELKGVRARVRGMPGLA
jgi:hypothetical protein